MQRHIRRLSLGVAAAAAFSAFRVTPTLSQQAPAADSVHTRPAAEVLTQLGRTAGVIVLADPTIPARLPVPVLEVTPASVEEQLATLVRALPAGTTWTKLYAPAPADGRWSLDAVLDYARALARQVGSVGRSPAPGTVEMLGRAVPAEKAGEYAAALNLKLVYLVTSSRPQSGPDAAANWSRLTPDQRAVYVQRQAQRLLALDPATRVRVMSQMMQEASPQQMVMRMVMEQMPDDERVQLKQSLGQGRQPGPGK